MSMIWMDVDAALAEVPVNICPLTSSADFITVDEGVTYDEAGMELYWHFVTTAGATSVTTVTPTTGATHDWAHQDHGMYTIEIPATGGASIDNDTEGFGYFTGKCTATLSWRGPTIGFRAASLNNALVDADGIGTPVSLDSGAATLAGMLTKMADDNGGSDFDAGTDSLEKIQTSVAAGFPQNINADVEPAGGVITTGTNTANDGDSTWANDGTYWQVAATTAVGGFGLNVEQVFTLGLTVKPSILRVNAKESLAGIVHVWLYDYGSAAFEQVSDADTAISGNADDDYTYIINGRHQQASDGEVRVRYTSTSEETNKYLYLDLVVIQAVAISDLTAAEIAQAVWETDLATVHGAFVNSAGHILQDTFAIVTTVGTGDTTTSFTLTAGQATNDCYNGMVIVVEDATDAHYEARRIVDYTSGRVVTVDRAFGFTPAAGDHAEIVNLSYADVNVTHLAASAIQQASGYAKVSTGTGTGQLSLASGVIASNMSQILGTALTETGGLLAGGFKKFFNVASPTGTLDSIPDAVAGAAGGLFIAGTNAETTITTALNANLIGDITGDITGGITGNITGNLSGSVGSVTGAVGSVTGSVGSVVGAVGSIATGGIVAASFAADAITAAAIAASAIVNATFAVDVGTTVYASNRIALAADKALVQQNLDHLMKAAVASNSDMSTEVVDGTVISNMLSATSTTSTYVVSTDSLEAMSVVLATVTTTTDEEHSIQTVVGIVDSG